MLSNLKYMLSNWIEWDKKSLLFFFVRVPALVLQPIVTAYIPKAMIDCIEKGVTTERLILVVALLSLLLTFTIWMDPFMKELIRGGARIVRMRYAVMAFRKNLSTDYVNIESLEGRELHKRAEAFYNARFSSGADFIEECNNFLVCIIGVIASTILIYKINILMILLILLTCVGEFIILKVLNKKQKITLDDSSKLSSKLDYFYKLSKSSNASKDIKLYGFQDYFIYTVAKITSNIEKIIAKYTNQSASVSGIRAVLNLIRQLISYVYLIYLVTIGCLTVSEFVFYFGIITGFSNWIVNLVFSYSKIERSANDCAVFRKYIESENESKDKPDVDFSEIESIEFKDVSFTYPSAEKSTINNMSFKINKGENIAIVGENGAGKTTAIKLLCGLYYPTNGDILINGKSSRDFSSENYFDLFSAVFQDYFFMPMTIAENISAEMDYDKEKLYSAFKKAGILEKINALPNKENALMDKNVYKNAVDFSGGEKQRIAIARAILKNAPILILDEATSASDPENQMEIDKAIQNLCKGKTVIVVAHRLSALKMCNRVAVVENHTITSVGTHEEVRKNNAYYRKAWDDYETARNITYQLEGGEQHE